MKMLLLTIAALLAPLCASADHLDVIQFKLKEGCTMDGYVAIKNDFNAQWGKSHGYLAEIASPVASNDLTSQYWIGRTASAEAFGKAWDVWRSELSDPKSVAAKLNERFQKCSTEESRRSYDIY
jgi:hypothetical protein